MLNWNDIDTVLLDMDGTLLDLYFDNHFWIEYLPQRFAQTHRRREEEARAELHQRFADLRGQLNWYCIDHWSEQLGLDVAALKREIQHLIAVRPYVPDFLRHLRSEGRQIWLVTNAHRMSLELKMERTGLGEHFDRLIISHDLRAAKEEQRFWHALHQRHPFNPERSLLIDDNVSVLRAAQRFGVRHLLTMLQPDSRQARRSPSACEFPGIVHFDELLPELRAMP